MSREHSRMNSVLPPFVTTIDINEIEQIAVRERPADHNNIGAAAVLTTQV